MVTSKVLDNDAQLLMYVMQALTLRKKYMDISHQEFPQQVAKFLQKGRHCIINYSGKSREIKIQLRRRNPSPWQGGDKTNRAGGALHLSSQGTFAAVLLNFTVAFFDSQPGVYIVIFPNMGLIASL
jgi:post-segregation antitoxin (ccd killing protein)